MMRASPVEMRKALESVQAMKAAGLLFVPIPVLDDNDGDELRSQMMARLERLAEEGEE